MTMQNDNTIRRLEQLSKILDRRWMPMSVAMALYAEMCAMDEPPRRILELGTFAGTGAVLLSTMAEQWGGSVTTVDFPWTGSANDKFTKTVDEWVAEFGIMNLTVVRMKLGAEGFLHEHIKSSSEPFDFAYIDDGHTWSHVTSQFISCLAAVRVGGCIAFDDLVNENSPDVRLVWDKIVCRIVPRSMRRREGRTGFVRVWK